MTFIPIDLTSFNNTPANTSPFTSIQDAIMKARQFELQKEKMRAEILLDQQRAGEYKRQNDLVEQGQKRSDQRFEVEEAKRMGTEGGNIFGALDQGRLGEAQHIAQSAQFMDPKTQKLRGISLAPLPNQMPAPGTAPQAPQMPEFVGPLETPEMAQQRQGPNAALDVMQQQAKREQFGADEASLPQRTAEYGQKKAAYDKAEANPDYELTYPRMDAEGNPITLRYNAGERQGAKDAKNKERAEKLIAMIGPNTPASVQQKIMEEAGLVQAGAGKETGAAIGGRSDTVQKQGWQGGENTKDRSLKMEIAQLQALSRRSRAAAAGGKKDDKADLELETKLDGIVQNVVRNTGYKDRVTDDRRFNQMALTIAGAGQNAALAAAAAGQWVKQAQGGVGTISDSDMKQFYTRIGSLGMKAEDAIAGYMEGTMGEGKRAVMETAIKELAAGAKRGMEDVNGRISARLAPIAKYVPLAGERLETYRQVYGAVAPPQAGPATAASNPVQQGFKKSKAQITPVDQDAKKFYDTETAAGRPVPANVVNGLRAKGLIP